jgi:hypothetical protein
MGPIGSPTPGDFYLYLLIDLVIIAALVWLCLGWRVGKGHLGEFDSTGDGSQPGGERYQRIPSRLFLRRTLGAIWILDGLLQAQPAMPEGFPTEVIAPAAVGQPQWLAALLHSEAFFWQAHPLDLAAATVLIQVGIGIAIMAGGESVLGRLGLWLSIGWGLTVWVGGEALGGVFGRGSSEIMGAPGAVLLYVVAAALLLTPTRLWLSGRVALWIRRGAGAFFLLGALLESLPAEGFWTRHGLSSMFLEMARLPQPSWLSTPILTVARSAYADPILLNSVFIVIMLALGLGLISGRAQRTFTVAALIWLALTWWLGQDFGGLGTRVATDPELSPLLAMLLIGAWIRVRPATAPHGSKKTAFLPKTLRRNLALGGLAAIAVGIVPSLLGLPIAASEAASQGTVATSGSLSLSASRPSLTHFAIVGKRAGVTITSPPAAAALPHTR